jgi:hypothetical protein
MKQFDYNQMIEGNADTMNPEDLLLASEQASELDGEQPASPEATAAAYNLGRVLQEIDPIALASLVVHYANEGGIPASASSILTQELERKIGNATPDELNFLISDAKARHVWPLVKTFVLERNEEIAQDVMEIASLVTLKAHLPVIATSTNWLPGPVYQAAAHVLCSLAEQAAGIGQLDAIAETAKEWRLLRSVIPVIKQRNSELVAAIQDCKATTGYVMQRGSQKILVENPLRALRMGEAGYEFVRQ